MLNYRYFLLFSVLLIQACATPTKCGDDCAPVFYKGEKFYGKEYHSKEEPPVLVEEDEELDYGDLLEEEEDISEILEDINRASQ